MPEVAPETHRALSRISTGAMASIEEAVGLREAGAAATGLDERTFGLVKIAALFALDAPPASYGRQVASALAGGATAEDILGVLHAVAPQIGGPKVVAAAPEIMLALGLALPEDSE